MNNFQSRLLVGSVYVVITIAALLTNLLTASFYIWAIQALCLYEFYKITIKKSSLKSLIVPLLIGSFVFLMTYANQDSAVNLGYLVWLLIPLLVVFLIYLIVNPVNDFINDAGKLVFGWIYVSVPFALLLRIGNMVFDKANIELLPYHGFPILLVFILIWANDSFAYLVGRKFGKTQLAPKLSPKKSVEGFIGGVFFSVLFAIAMHYFFPVFDQIHFIVLAIICGTIGTLGDLFESKLKRSLGIKDSGTMLGGHGGFLDRMDSIIFAGPICFFYLYHFTVA